MSAPSEYRLSSSSTTSVMVSGCRNISINDHAAVPEVVWWPANIIEMKMPVISSALNRRSPFSSLTETNTVQHVAVILALRRIRDAPVHDVLYQSDQRQPGLVAAAETLDRRVRIHESQCNPFPCSSS